MSATALDDFLQLVTQINPDDYTNRETSSDTLLEKGFTGTDGKPMTAARLRNALRAGEDAGYGKFIIGRRGYPTRFVWGPTPTKATAPAAAPAAAPVAPAASAVVAAADSQGGLEYTLRLRADFTVKMALPPDLTIREAERLAHWMQALPLD